MWYFLWPDVNRGYWRGFAYLRVPDLIIANFIVYTDAVVFILIFLSVIFCLQLCGQTNFLFASKEILGFPVESDFAVP